MKCRKTARQTVDQEFRPPFSVGLSWFGERPSDGLPIFDGFIRNEGFTLIELVMSLSIIAVLAVTLYGSLSGTPDDARVAKARADLDTHVAAIRSFEARTGRIPYFTRELRGRFLSRDAKDPWGSDYFIDLKRGAAVSFGRDGRLGTGDDISAAFEPDHLFPVKARFLCPRTPRGKVSKVPPILEITFSKSILSKTEGAMAIPPLYDEGSDFSFFRFAGETSDGPWTYENMFVGSGIRGILDYFIWDFKVVPRAREESVPFPESGELPLKPDSFSIRNPVYVVKKNIRSSTHIRETGKLTRNHFTYEFPIPGSTTGAKYTFAADNFDRVLYVPVTGSFAGVFSRLDKGGRLYLNTIPSTHRQFAAGDPSVSFEEGRGYTNAIVDLSGRTCVPNADPVAVEWVTTSKMPNLGGPILGNADPEGFAGTPLKRMDNSDGDGQPSEEPEDEFAADEPEAGPETESPNTEVPKGDVIYHGISAKGSRFVFIIDRSTSMTNNDRISKAKTELLNTISALNPSAFFKIIFYSSGPDLMWPEGALVKVTPQNLGFAFAWVESIEPFGATEPRQAILSGLAEDPDALFFLSDGSFDETVADAIATRNSRVPIHTICFEERTCEPLMQRLAHDSGGEYMFVPK